MNVKRVAAESHHISVIQKTPQIMELCYISFKRHGCLEFTLNRNYHVIFENFPTFYKEILYTAVNTCRDINRNMKVVNFPLIFG